MHRRLYMETKVWDNSFSKEDIEQLIGRGITEGEWNIVVDELYNNDKLYTIISDAVFKIAIDAVGDE